MGISFRILLYDRKIRKREVEGSYRRKNDRESKTPCRSIHIFMAIGFYRLPPWRTEKRNERTFSTGGCRCPSCRYGNTLPRQSRCGSALPMACGMLRFRYFRIFRWNRSEGRITSRQKFSGSKVRYFQRHEKSLRVSGRYGSGGYLTECGTLRSRECRSVPAV